MEDSDWIGRWFSIVREQSNLRVERIPFEASKEWVMQDGWITHTTGRFFKVVAARWDDLQKQTHAQPFFHQPEIGTLGFIFHNQALLLQAKVEPGNVGAVQIAPTCQATASNIDRVHGGATPLFFEWFLPALKNRIFVSLQSEQGSRFLGKFNRNALTIADSRISANDYFRWVAVDAILELFHADFLINTDARSTIVCSPWELLVNREAFTRISSPFARELAASYKAEFQDHGVQDEFLRLRRQAPKPSMMRLDELDGWQTQKDSILSDHGKPFEIHQIQVHAATREVSSWDQPIISSLGEGFVELVCGRIDGLLHFLFSYQMEAGLQNAVELGPSLIVEPGEPIPKNTYSSHHHAAVKAECKQSDEGGRFFQDISTYRLIDLGKVPDELMNAGKWLTLSEISMLLGKGGYFTNEARSALSLVLFWL